MRMSLSSPFLSCYWEEPCQRWRSHYRYWYSNIPQTRFGNHITASKYLYMDGSRRARQYNRWNAQVPKYWNKWWKETSIRSRWKEYNRDESIVWRHALRQKAKKRVFVDSVHQSVKWKLVNCINLSFAQFIQKNRTYYISCSRRSSSFFSSSSSNLLAGK